MESYGIQWNLLCVSVIFCFSYVLEELWKTAFARPWGDVAWLPTTHLSRWPGSVRWHWNIAPMLSLWRSSHRNLHWICRNCIKLCISLYLFSILFFLFSLIWSLVSTVTPTNASTLNAVYKAKLPFLKPVATPSEAPACASPRGFQAQAQPPQCKDPHRSLKIRSYKIWITISFC